MSEIFPGMLEAAGKAFGEYAPAEFEVAWQDALGGVVEDNGLVFPENTGPGMEDLGEYSPLLRPSENTSPGWQSESSSSWSSTLQVGDSDPLEPSFGQPEDTSASVGGLEGDSDQASVKGTHEENSPPKEADGSEGSDDWFGNLVNDDVISRAKAAMSDANATSTMDDEGFISEVTNGVNTTSSDVNAKSIMENDGRFFLFGLAAIGLLFLCYYCRKRQSRRNRNQNRNADQCKVEHTNNNDCGIVEESNDVPVHDNRSSGVDLTLAELV